MAKGRRPAANIPTQDLPPLAECPEWLHHLAKEEWARITPLLDLKAVDLGVTAAYCQTFAKWRRAEGQLDKGLVTDKGKPSPFLGVSEALVRQLRNLAECLGFTPAARGRLKGAVEKVTAKQSELDEFLDG